MTDDKDQPAPFDLDPLRPLTGRIIASGFGVQRRFGYGFLESVYRRALVVEMQYHGVTVAQEVRYELFHRGVPVGLFRADIVADSRIIVEVKTGLSPDPVARSQLLNYLRAADLSLGILIHFGTRGATIKRVIASPEYRSRWQ